MDEINKILTRGVEKILPSKDELAGLMAKRKIKLYQGFDPTGGRLHLGHTIGLRKLMQFANAGHEVIFLFGTGTVLVGDPSERDTGRKLITQKEIEENIKDWKSQVAPIINFDKIKIMYNGDWLTKLTLKEIINIASNISAVQLFKRDSFQRRIDKGDTVWYHETMYPLLQGYDSVVMDVDLEIGGTDQEFNMLIGRELQKKMNNREKYILTVPMITGTDGKQMSKTSGNCVWLDDKPNEMYGKIMSLADSQIVPYMTLLTDIAQNEINDSNPLKAKKKLAHEIVSMYHSQKDADNAEKYFENSFQKGNLPENIKALPVKKDTPLLEFMTANQLVPSRSEGKRLIKQSAVDIDGQPVSDLDQTVGPGSTIKIGKKTFIKTKDG